MKYHADLEIYDRFGFTAVIQAALENRVLILQVSFKHELDLRNDRFVSLTGVYRRWSGFGGPL